MTATLANPNINDVATFIHQASEESIGTIQQLIANRRKNIQNERAAQVTIGKTVTLTGLTPKYLNGLTGEVADLSGTRANILLDEDSTLTLRLTDRTGKFSRNFGSEKRGTLKGVPLVCLVVTA